MELTDRVPTIKKSLEEQSSEHKKNDTSKLKSTEKEPLKDK